MGHFEEYLKQQKKQEQMMGEPALQEQEVRDLILEENRNLYEEQKASGLGADVEAGEETADYHEMMMRQRMAQTTFLERTDYYFKNAGYLEAKAERYRRLSEDRNGELNSFAERHTNRSAKKRKKKAANAAKYFEKAKKLEEKMGNKQLSPLDTYKARNEIMRARMEGMVNAAKVKSTSDANEEYRIAKAKFSCLSQLYDQAQNLDAQKSKDFEKIHTNLKKEIADVIKTLRKYDANAKWKEALGANDKAVLKKQIRDSGNPNATMEDASISLLLNPMAEEYMRPEYVAAAEKSKEVFGKEMDERRDPLMAVVYFVKRDKHGNPINKKELKKEEWNKKWLKACQDPAREGERNQMILEAYGRIKDFHFPTPEELKTNGALHYFKKDPAAVYEVYTQSIRLDNLKKFVPFVQEYYQHDKVFQARMDAAMWFSQCLSIELMSHNLDENAHYHLGNGNAERDEEDLEAAKERDRVQMQLNLSNYEAHYAKIQGAEEAYQKEEAEREKHRTILSYQEAKESAKQNGNAEFNEVSYEKYKAFKVTNQIMEFPQYRIIYEPIHNKLGNQMDISRVCGAMLREVHFNEKMQPVSEEDMKAHEWNIRYLNRLSIYFMGSELTEEQKEQNENEMKEMVEEEYTRCFSGDHLLYTLPAPEELKTGMLDAMKNEQPINVESFEKIAEQPDSFITMCQKTLTFEGTYKNLPFVTEMIEGNQEFMAVQNVQRQLGQLVNLYYGSKYRMTPDLGCTVSTGYIPLDQEYLEYLISEYEKFYSDLQKIMKEKNKEIKTA